MAEFLGRPSKDPVAKAATRAVEQVSDLQDEIKRLDRRIDKLVLVNQALWELVQEKTGLSEIELKSRVLEVDARDGAIDGRLGATVLHCAKCGKAIAHHHRTCMYCGQAIEFANPFEAV
jgi:Fe2+ or Zn2+ uptake regulation protein